MTAIPITYSTDTPTLARRLSGNRRVAAGAVSLVFILGLCLFSLPVTLHSGGDLYYNQQHDNAGRLPPTPAPLWKLMGTTKLGQSLLGRCGVGGLISLMIGLAAAAVAVSLGVTVGLISGYAGGWVDNLLMRVVEVLDCLPYILMVILLKLGLQGVLQSDFIRHRLHVDLSNQAVNIIVMFLAIGLVSWLTMARVIRGQVLALRQMPFVDAARAVGAPTRWILLRHLLPNLIGPIVVYATLTVPGAILQESTLSFLGIGIQPPLPTWGSLASEGMRPALNPIHSDWWLLTFPCILLAVTLLSLNFLGDGLRDVFDPRRRSSGV